MARRLCVNRTTLLALAAALGSLAAAAPAGAATLTVDHQTGTLVYQGAAGESNHIQATGAAGVVKIDDGGASAIDIVENGASVPGCVLLQATRVRCAFPGLARAKFRLGGGSDTLDTTGLSLPVVVHAGKGSNKIETGPGDDQIFARNASTDRIECGDGNDSVTGDPQDVVTSDCEHADLSVAATTDGGTEPGSTPATGDGGGSGATAPAPDGGATPADGDVPPPPVSLPNPIVALTHPGTAVVQLDCSAASLGGCHGEVFLALPAAGGRDTTMTRATAARGHFVAQQAHRIGKGRFKIAPGHTAVVPVTLRGHFAIQSRRRHRQALLEVVLRDASGKVVAIETTRVTLKVSNKWSRIRRNRSSR
jgi:hypothetical protein